MEIKEAGKIRGEPTFQRVEVSRAEVGGPGCLPPLESERKPAHQNCSKRDRGETARPSGFQGCVSLAHEGRVLWGGRAL